MSGMPRPELVLFTPLTPEQVAAKLAEVVAGGPFSQFSGKPLEGRVNTQNLVLFKRVNYNNSSKPGLYARLEPTFLGGHSGTIIRGKFGMARPALAFMMLWFGGVIFFNLMWLSAIISDRQSLSSGDFMPLGMLFFGVVWWLIGLLNRNDPDFIRQQLIQQLGASELG